VRATAINDEMKLAATYALSLLAKQDVPDSVRKAYGVDEMEFGPLYLIPKPFDTRVLTWVAPAVARAAIETGVAQLPIEPNIYRERLEMRLGKSQEVMRMSIHKAQRRPKRVVLPEGDQDRILRAAQILVDERIARPILIGNPDRVRRRAAELHLHFDGAVDIVDPQSCANCEAYINEFVALRNRKGVTPREAPRLLADHTRFGCMMVHMGDADAMIAGVTQHYPETIRPALEIISLRPGVRKLAGMYMLIMPKGQIYFLADTTMNIEPSAEDLAEIAVHAAEAVRGFNVEPRVAMLSFSNFGSTRHPLAEKVRTATKLARLRAPWLEIDGEMMADTAVTPELLAEYPFSKLTQPANVLIAPSLESGNIAYKLLMRLGGAEVVGPILLGFSKPVAVLQRGAEVNEIVHMAALAVVEAQSLEPVAAD
ncbi:MAG: NADP-dependent malic enzyme, partial [Candidatus Solibacter sp.]|nr:NADP-dependent malic enzyme [Candidatus Solibacter sp.]